MNSPYLRRSQRIFLRLQVDARRRQLCQQRGLGPGERGCGVQVPLSPVVVRLRAGR